MVISAITFDFWGTLFRDARLEERKAVRVDALSTIAEVEPGAAESALNSIYDQFFRVHVSEQRTLGPMDAVLLACSTLDVSLDPQAREQLADAFARAILDFPPEPIDDALEAVRAAAARVPVAVICDSGISHGEVLRILLDRHEFTSHFAALTFSDEVGVSKPQAPMYEVTARALDVHPSGLLHIGDLDPTDIVGVHNVGGKGALFAAVNRRFVETTRADYTFHTWREFIARLDELLDCGRTER